MALLAQTGTGVGDTQTFTISMWFRLTAAELASAGPGSVGPSSRFPLIQFGIAEDDVSSFFWSKISRVQAVSQFPGQFGGPADPTPPTPSPPESCTIFSQAAVDVDNYTGSKTLDNAVSFPIVMGQPQLVYTPTRPAAPGAANLLHLTYTDHWWVYRVGVDPDTLVPYCEGGGALSAGSWGLATQYWKSFPGIDVGRRPCTIAIDKSNARIRCDVVSLKDPEFSWDSENFSANAGIVLNSWNHLLISLDTTTVNAVAPTQLYLNGANRLASAPFVNGTGENDDQPFVMGISDLEIGLPKVPSDISRNSGSGENKQVRFAYVQGWFDQYIEATPTNLSKFFKVSGDSIVPPTDKLAARKAFGPGDIHFYRDSLEKVQFKTNHGSAGTFSQSGGVTDFEPGPGQTLSMMASAADFEDIRAPFAGRLEDYIEPKPPRYYSLPINVKTQRYETLDDSNRDPHKGTRLQTVERAKLLLPKRRKGLGYVRKPDEIFTPNLGQGRKR